MKRNYFDGFITFVWVVVVPAATLLACLAY